MSSPEASFAMSSAAVLSVMASSSAVNQPDVSGQVVTSSWESGGSRVLGARHSGGMEAARDSRFLAAASSQGSVLRLPMM